MDKLSLLGIAIGVMAIFGGNLIEGGSLSSLLNFPAALIVVGGTLGATLLQTPPHLLLPSCRSAKQVFLPERIDFSTGQKKVQQWAAIARREGLLGIESLISKEKDPFMLKGLELLVDGYEPEIIRDILWGDRYLQERSALESAKIFESMGGYAPTIGILGAVLGLIQVMGNLADPSQLGHGIAVAFVATIYGVGLANLVFLPMAAKLSAHAHRRAIFQEMITEGLVAIADGQNPRSIGIRLQDYGCSA